MNTVLPSLCAVIVGFGLSVMAAVPDPDPVQFHEGLSIVGAGRASRTTVLKDAVEALRVRGGWKPPIAGDSLSLGDGRTASWTQTVSDTNGAFAGDWLRGGRLLVTVPYHGRFKDVLIALFKWDEHFTPTNPHIP